MTRAGIAIAIITLLAGCNTAPAGPPAVEVQATASMSAHFNDTDVMFLQMLIAHHGPATHMLALAKKRAQRQEVRTLAAAVEATQADETRMMTEWLTSWGEPVTSDAHPDAHAHHGGLPTGEAEMDALTQASDAEFDKVFLNVFIGYQHRAVDLAKMEINSGGHIQTVDFAGRVDESRRAQIQLMLGYVS